MDEHEIPYAPIGCADYEHVELVCMDRNQVEVVTDDATIRGLAADTAVGAGGEFLVIEQDDGHCVSVRVDRIRKIKVLSDVRRFDEWEFQTPTSSNG